MIADIFSGLVAGFSLVFCVFYCTSLNKNRTFIFSIALNVLFACFALLYGHLMQYVLIIFPIFMVSDVIFYYYSSASPSTHIRSDTKASTKIFHSFFLWAVSVSLAGLLYKFLSVEDGSWLGRGGAGVEVEFSQIGNMLWAPYFFIVVLFSILILLVGIGAMLMVRAGD